LITVNYLSTIPEKIKMLGYASGSSNQETECAKDIGIPDGSVTGKLSLNGLCKVCRPVLKAIQEQTACDIHSIADMIKCSEKSCHLCSIFLAEIQEYYIAKGNYINKDEPLRVFTISPELEFPVEVNIFKLNKKQETVGKIRIDVTSPGHPLVYPNAPHSLHNYNILNFPHWGRCNAVPEGAEEVWVAKYIWSWLDRCVTSHGATCNGVRHGSVDLPTRLLKLIDYDKIRLVETRDLFTPSDGSGISYASMSHVWGSGNYVTLTTKNHADFKSVIPFLSLDVKFRQVIRIAFALKIRYLWIDTLCIVQDDLVDWRRESGKMAAVYQNAVINFAPVGSNKDDICITPRNTLGLFPLHISGTSDGGRSTHVWITRSNDLVSQISGFDEKPPLLTRGWIWQERFLSRRTIYLGLTQMVWECCECLWLESSGELVNHYDSLGIHHYCKRTHHSEKPKNWHFVPDEPLRRWAFHWSNIVAGLTSAQLTYGSDKLAAIAGIAKSFENATSQTYIAGMWREQMSIGSLLWEVTECKPRPPFRGASTWSWASVDGKFGTRLQFARRDGEMVMRYPETRVLNITVVEPQETDFIFGAVSKAILRVAGKFMYPRYRTHDNGSKLSVDSFVPWSRVDKPEFGKATGLEANELEVVSSNVVASLTNAVSGIALGGIGNKVNVNLDVPVAEERLVFFVLSTDDSWPEGLVLKPLDDHNLFERVGAFTIDREAINGEIESRYMVDGRVDVC
jgi:hypothetical protein